MGPTEGLFMSSSMAVPLTSTSPPSDVAASGEHDLQAERDSSPAESVETGRRRSLTCTALPQSQVTGDERDEMYGLLETYFCGTDRARFDADLREKQIAILLRDAHSGRIQGFSTLMHMTTWIGGQEVVAFFSGDTIIDREYWGETVLSRIWCQTVFAEVDRIALARPTASIYWFLICSGYKTWKFLPLFFRRFYPNVDEPTPSGIRQLIDALGAAKFGDEYLADSGIVRFREPTPLRRGVATVTEERLRDPQVAFFVQQNPGHAGGDELACVAELSRANLTRAGLRMMSRPL
jgi:hypothetical protein